MTYSVESLVFRAVGCAVNTAARAANNLLEQMYPREDPGHVWDDSPREGVEAALADPHPVGVDDPAGGHVPPAPPAGSLNPDLVSFFELQCIAEEILRGHLLAGPSGTTHRFFCSCGDSFLLVGEWSDHVAEIQISAITDRLRVEHIASATREAGEFFPQSTKPKQ